MNLTHDAMLVSLRINSWSGRLYDRQASQQVAVHNDADTNAGRYNKRLLPKQAFAALAATMSNARTSHNSNTLPWDDQGGRLLTVANYERYTAALDTLVERVVRERARFIEDYDDYVDQARLDLGRLFRLEDYPGTEALQGKFAIRYRIVPVPDARHFMADLAQGETERVKRDIEQQVRTRLNDAQRDLYRRLSEAVERVGERLREDENGKPLVFRDSLIENIRELVDVVPRLNIFADDDLAMLCREVKDKFAGIEPDALRPSGRFDPNLRRQVKRDADALKPNSRATSRPRPRTGKQFDGRPLRIRPARQRLRDRRDPERWQRASQLVTHGLLRDAGFVLPPEAEAWDGISAEQAYDRLPEPSADAEDPGDASSSSDVDDSGSAAGPQCGDGDEDQSDPSNPSGDNSPQEQAEPGSGSGSAGSEPSGQTPASHDPCGTGEVMDADERRDDATGQSGESPVDTPAEEQAWDEAMHQAASLARAQGNAPGAVEETIRQAHRSILDWRSLLRRYMTDAARRDYSWSVPNRRFIDSGLYLPSMHSQGIDANAIIIDTSASLPGETLALFWAEVREIAAELQPDSIFVLQVDAVLQDAAQYPAGELPDSITIKGRGGTDFRPGFAWLHEHGVHPNCCLYLTDMECDSYPEAAPPYPVAWVVWGGDRYREPWGERIDIGPA